MPRAAELVGMASSTFVQTKGTPARFSFNQLSGRVRLAKVSSDIAVRYVRGDTWQQLTVGEAVPAPLPYEGLMSVVSDQAGTHTAVIENVDHRGRVLAELRIELLVMHVRVDVDADRDGVIGDNEEGKRNWAWGEQGRGAIVLVNNDRDTAEFTIRQAERSELVEVLVRPTQARMPEGCELVLVTTADEAERISLYRAGSSGELELVLGVDPARRGERPREVSPSMGSAGAHCFLEAHEYPGPFFEGLISLELQLRQHGGTIGSDRALLRVAPWIMTPNTLPPVEVYTCDTGADNEQFRTGLHVACDAAGVPVRVVPPDVHGGDRWIQDEVEFGFSASPSHTLTVVCDSPRDRGLRDWAAMQLGPDLGHFQIGGSTPNSLDAFGNLEVSPPVTVRGLHYPYGRIIFGGRAYGDYGESNRQMMPELRRFFHAQKVQAPIELYTDWLMVGHVDEIVNFIPAEVEKGFQILLASPRKAEGIVDRLLAEGHGDAVLFRGLRRGDPIDGDSAEITVQELRADTGFWAANAACQSSMDLNRELLMMELEVSEANIIEVPLLFWPPGIDGRTAAFFPDMVNHLVLGNVSVVPRPYGPEVDGVDAFAEELRTSMPGRIVHFVDDWYAYHEMLGEVHCGTNVRRLPPKDVYWWEHRPEGGYDV
ncbi:MAG: protein-arginine deiminase family protein [Pseudonocardiaceae bacterium]